MYEIGILCRALPLEVNGDRERRYGACFSFLGRFTYGKGLDESIEVVLGGTIVVGGEFV
ncbi:MAG: hypothetical protein LBL23_00685 [Coriobacteriales bacterium]|jgi:hypothetical protein|nr:hypothetical protein [Coriobacteriales bacterium]